MNSEHNDSIPPERAWGTLCEWFAKQSSTIVLLSGGVDSSLLLSAARATLNSVLAVTADSPSLARSEADIIRSFVADLGAPHVWLQTDELHDSRYVSNSGDRCYFCKKALYRAIDRDLPMLMSGYPDAVVVDGTNTDDLRGHRPSIPASREHDIRHPYVELGFDKRLIRELARYRGLTMWNKPAMACLSSRVQEGIPVSIERLSLIERAEKAIAALGFNSCRVRYHESGAGEHLQRIARIEVPSNMIPALVSCPELPALVRTFREYGFNHITVDLEGYKMGGVHRS